MGWWLALPPSVRGWIEKIFSLVAWTVVCLGLGAATSWNYLHHKYKAEKLEAENAQKDAVNILLQDQKKRDDDLRSQLDTVRSERDIYKDQLANQFKTLSKELHDELSKPAAKCVPTERAISLWNDSLRSGSNVH